MCQKWKRIWWWPLSRVVVSSVHVESAARLDKQWSNVHGKQLIMMISWSTGQTCEIKLIMNNISVKIPLQESTLYSPPMLGHHLKSICWKCLLLKSVHLPCTCEGWFFYMDNISIIRISHHWNFLHLGTFSLNKGKEKTRKDECKVHDVHSPNINMNLNTFV